MYMNLPQPQKVAYKGCGQVYDYTNREDGLTQHRGDPLVLPRCHPCVNTYFNDWLGTHAIVWSNCTSLLDGIDQASMSLSTMSYSAVDSQRLAPQYPIIFHYEAGLAP